MGKAEEVTEYQKVAALVCLEIDVIVTAAESNPDMALELLKRLKDRKDLIVNDKDHRDMRYGACCAVFSAKING